MADQPILNVIAGAHAGRAHHGISRASAPGFHRFHRAACHFLCQTGFPLREISRLTIPDLAALLYGASFWRDDFFLFFDLRNCLSRRFRQDTLRMLRRPLSSSSFPFFWLFWMLGWVANVILGIVYGIKANRGEWAGYPIIGNWCLPKPDHGATSPTQPWRLEFACPCSILLHA